MDRLWKCDHDCENYFMSRKSHMKSKPLRNELCLQASLKKAGLDQ